MTSHERFQRMYEHREADRVPVLDSPWSQTIDRWVEEGMPTRDYVGYFDLDRVATITTDNSPRYPQQILEETDDYVIVKTAWGVTHKTWKKHGSTPEFLDFTITDAEKWLDAKKRMTSTPPASTGTTSSRTTPSGSGTAIGSARRCGSALTSPTVGWSAPSASSSR